MEDWKETKTEITIKVPTINFDDIKNIIENKDVQLIAPEIHQLLMVQQEMANAKIAFNKKVKYILKEFNYKYQELDTYLDEVKKKLVDYVQKTSQLTKTKTNKMSKDGVVKEVEVEKLDYTLPKGFIYNKGRTTIIYNESFIQGDEYYKKTLIKNEVKKAIKEGRLGSKAISHEAGEPSITFKITDIKKGIENNEKK